MHSATVEKRKVRVELGHPRIFVLLIIFIWYQSKIAQEIRENFVMRSTMACRHYQTPLTL